MAMGQVLIKLEQHDQHQMVKNGYIKRIEFSLRAKYELERILTQPDYSPL